MLCKLHLRPLLEYNNVGFSIIIFCYSNSLFVFHMVFIKYETTIDYFKPLNALFLILFVVEELTLLFSYGKNKKESL